MHELERDRARSACIPTRRNARDMRMSRIAGNYLLRCALACALPFLGIATTRAQMACPQGVTPGSAQCLPSGSGAQNAPSAARWRLTWGAMAEDEETGNVGTSTGKVSRGAARREAMRKCKAMGGRNCRPIFDYQNNCAVVVEPIQFIDGSSIAIYRDGSSIADASGVALATCAQRNGRECKVNYSNCTHPVLVN